MHFFANIMWSGAMPYGFQFFGLHVIVELGAEIAIICYLLRGIRQWATRRWVGFAVVTANLASFILGTLVLTFFTVPKTSLSASAAAWLGAFVISWVTESGVVGFIMKTAGWRTVFHACFWANVASYAVAILIFIAHSNGARFPWMTGH